ncbi:hypothetical protein [Nocardioides sp. LHG3406-4]|uniref:hypothetical protein n=1 Tax=Nocardioides sp. LHG3406-4 TaxID=2804575 RepID=UPI003CF11FF7
MSNPQKASESQATGLHMQWSEVRDERGRTRLEARWVCDPPSARPHPAPTPHAA